MQMRVNKQFYMIFVLLRACLWNVSSSFARDGQTEVTADYIKRDEEGENAIIMASREVFYVAGIDILEKDEFLRTQVSRVVALPVFCRDKKYTLKDISGERARFLRLLLFPNHSFG